MAPHDVEVGLWERFPFTVYSQPLRRLNEGAVHSSDLTAEFPALSTVH